MIEGVIITPLSTIDLLSGNVLHCLKSTEKSYAGFGEAYFSEANDGFVKGWKRHKKMFLNLIVPIGSIHFVLYDDRPESLSYNEFQEIIISRTENYCRLTVPPMVWMGFQGLDKNGSILLNIASIEHSSEEVDQKELNEIIFDWKVKK
jgi:dTDP-4-dehydrorhamnose 3,5-epimerase